MNTKATGLIATLVKDFLQQEPSLAEKLKAACNSEYGFMQEKGRLIPYLTPKRLAESLMLSLKTLERMRKDGTGPKFQKITTKHIRYPIVELDRWVRETVTNSQCADDEKSGQ